MANLLIIDDDVKFLESLMQSLVSHGHSVHICPDSEVGVSYAVANQPDLVITDVIMPKLNGLQVIMTLKRQAPNTKIIAMSIGGYSDEAIDNTLEAVTVAGACAFMAKPFEGYEMAELVDLVLSGEEMPQNDVA